MQECSDMNEKYKSLRTEIKELDYAHQTLDDYFRNEQKKEQKRDLEL